MSVISFISCPCHLPLILLLALALLTGTPAAGWIAQHTNWVYGGMLILFLAGLALWFVRMGKKDAGQLNCCAQPKRGEENAKNKQ